MERGSISDSLAGSSYFMVQLPDGSMEKRLKMPINIDPGVHSSFNLDQLIPGETLKIGSFNFMAGIHTLGNNLKSQYFILKCILVKKIDFAFSWV